MTEFFTASDGARLAFRDETIGGGTLPLLCLSGLTRTMADFDYLVPHLPPVRLIRTDYRGRGESQWTGSDTYSLSREALDAVQLLDHLGVERAAVLGTSRGGLIALMLGVTVKPRLIGVAFNDIGPVLEKGGLDRILDYLGRNPAAKTWEQIAEASPRVIEGFANVPASRWLEEARKHYRPGPRGMTITYDPALRDSMIAALELPETDSWPLFDALDGLPLALIRGANSDLLSTETAAEMRRRRPDMLYAGVPDRAHIPFLDEPDAVAVLRDWIALCAGDAK